MPNWVLSIDWTELLLSPLQGRTECEYCRIIRADVETALGFNSINAFGSKSDSDSTGTGTFLWEAKHWMHLHKVHVFGSSEIFSQVFFFHVLHLKWHLTASEWADTASQSSWCGLHASQIQRHWMYPCFLPPQVVFPGRVLRCLEKKTVNSVSTTSTGRITSRSSWYMI